MEHSFFLSVDFCCSFFIFLSHPTRLPTLIAESSIRQPNCWMSEIQTDVLELILKRLAFVDIVRFRAVCSTWKMAVESYISSPIYRPFPQTPWLLDQGISLKTHWRFFNPTETKFYNVQNHLSFVTKSWVKGSLDDGWILMMDETSNTYIYNPFSEGKIQLPLLNTLIPSPKVLEIRCKIVLGKNSSFAAIMICYGCYCWPKNLAFCKLGDNTWKPTQLENQSYLDIICHNDQIYALSSTGKIDIWDFLCSFPMITIDFGRFPTVPKILDQWRPLKDGYGEPYRRTYLIKSLDEVMIVERIMYSRKYFTVGLIVSKLDFKEGRRIPCRNLQDRAIFIDAVSAVLVSTQDCQENSIFFYDDNHLGVYNLEEYKINRYLNEKWEKLACRYWVFPNPW